MKTVLTIAGSDSSGGAGIQADLKTISAHNCYGMSVITAVTAQNTLGVQRSDELSDDLFLAQLTSVLDDITPDAVKIGMICSQSKICITAGIIERYHLKNIVIDPVMLSTSGTQLMADECIDYIMQTLFPLCTLITPNLPEALRLSGLPAGSDAEAMGRRLVSMCGTAFLLKGGHVEGRLMRDILYCPDGERHEYCSPRIDSPNLHGTGCTLSSAVAALLAEGRSLPEAVAGAKALIDKGIAGGRALRIGRGNGPLWLF